MTLSVFEVEGGNADLKQIQEISAKFRCEVARNGKIKNRNFTPPFPKKFWR